MADALDSAAQFPRVCTLLVADRVGNALDLSELHIKFAVKRSDTMTPNIADIRVYNLEEQTAIRIRKEFTTVILQAGYPGNFGVIFRGNIKQVIVGRESATDTYIDIIAGDGDRAYNFSVINQTLAAGATQTDQVQSAIASMAQKGVTAGKVDSSTTQPLPRGKVMWGNARDYMRAAAQNSGNNWSIQDEKINFIPKKSYLPGEAVVLTSKTGMINAPEQTNEGVNVKCLINPRLAVAGRVHLDNASIQRYKINLSVPNSPQNIPPPINADGIYYILVVEHNGDNRGIEWYSSLICIAINVTTNPLNSVQVSYGP